MNATFEHALAPIDFGNPAAPHFEAAAPRSGPTFLFVHGFMMSRAIWADNLDAFAQIGRPVVVELLGHGRSPAPADDDAYRVARYLEWFEAARRRLDVERWVIVGHSFGAALALNYALGHPEAVSAVVVTNSVSAFDSPDKTAAQARAAAVTEALATDGAAALPNFSFHPKHLRNVSPSLRDALIDDSERIDVGAIEKSIRITAPDLGVSDRLPDLRPPALLVNGLREKGFQEARHRAEGATPQLEIIDLDGGHSINAEEPEAFNKAARDFLARHLKEDVA